MISTYLSSNLLFVLADCSPVTDGCADFTLRCSAIFTYTLIWVGFLSVNTLVSQDVLVRIAWKSTLATFGERKFNIVVLVYSF